jgi:hypothetical protein
MSVSGAFMNGLSAVGSVRSSPTYELTKDSVIFRADGNHALRRIVSPKTRGMISM